MKLAWEQEGIMEEELCLLEQNFPTPCSHNINIFTVFNNYYHPPIQHPFFITREINRTNTVIYHPQS